MRSGFVERQAAWARALFKDVDRLQRAGAAVNFEDVNAATITRRQVDLRWQHVVKRRAERADVGDQPPLFPCDRIE